MPVSLREDYTGRIRVPRKGGILQNEMPKKGVGHKTESLGNGGGCLRIPEKACPLPLPHPWVVLSALTVLPPILSLFNFYPDNFPPQIFFPILTFFLSMTYDLFLSLYNNPVI